MKTGVKFGFAALAILALNAPAGAEGDAAKGEKQFAICKACHDVGEGAKVKQSSVLNNIIGRTAGADEAASDKYSALMKAAGANGLVWNEETISGYLADPSEFLTEFLKKAGKDDLAKGKSKMVIKIKQDDKRANIIAYLKTFSQKP